ncbi:MULTISPECIES: citrate synthase [unclassified Streptomyces]|uniref:citrate synthase n=1 Tax=unclassified Streptomyces TaxID=2593676 RepID=UPI001906D300|nr:citrate synthase [Streptomyces sp. HSG2]
MDDTEADSPAPGERRLTTREAADLLGVKPATVYAYVSRGRLDSRRSPDGRGSTFDPAEVRALARRPRSTTTTARPDDQTRVRTEITLITEGRLYYRGIDAVELVSRHGYEEVAEWLWTGTTGAGTGFAATEASLLAARRSVEALPEHAGPTDHLRVAAVATAATDPLRFDLSKEAVLASARVLIPTMVTALPAARHGHRVDKGPLADRLWSRLAERTADDASLRALDAALGLLADHDLAASTRAVRVAASARAHVYAAVSAGLGVIEGPLHGAACGEAHRLLQEVLARGNAAPVIAQELRAGRRIPGLGHSLYAGEDPRARALFALLEDVPGAEPALAAAREITTGAARHAPLHANVDLALAALCTATGMPASAGETIFAVARTAGWVAHALEEYQEPPLPLRPSGLYVGPPPRH